MLSRLKNIFQLLEHVGDVKNVLGKRSGDEMRLYSATEWIPGTFSTRLNFGVKIKVVVTQLSRSVESR